MIDEQRGRGVKVQNELPYYKLLKKIYQAPLVNYLNLVGDAGGKRHQENSKEM